MLRSGESRYSDKSTVVVWQAVLTFNLHLHTFANVNCEFVVIAVIGIATGARFIFPPLAHL